MTDAKLFSKASSYSFMPYNTYSDGYWGPDDYDKMDAPNLKEYRKVVKQCRFFYRKDPIASTVVNKTIDIGISSLIFDKGNLTDNEFKIFIGLKPDLESYSRELALEYLLSGLVVPEISYARINTSNLSEYKVKKKSYLYLPESMWIRNAETIDINYSFIMGKPSYYIEVPDEMVFFIMNNGKYPDGTKDEALYAELLKLYPDFVAKVKSGQKKILIEDDKLITRRKVLTDSQYPTPYLYASLEAFKHKRNLRRMDYAIAARVISAILHTKVGNDEYPVTEDDDTVFENIKNQFYYRDKKNVERIFHFITNHTVEMEWVTPDVSALLSEKKYAEINQDIFFGLGFPRILTTGETERSSSSDPEFASLSPVKTMEAMQKDVLPIIKDIVKNVSDGNNLRDVPDVRFAPINLQAFRQFVEGMTTLYESGNLSRTSFAGAFGYNLEEEMKQKAVENELMEQLEIEEFAPQPFSPQPNVPGQPQNNRENQQEDMQNT